jgi:hypothetical protein
MPRDEQRICGWCSREYTAIRQGPGRPPLYCSDACRRQARKALNAGWMRRTRAQQREAEPWNRRPVGRPRTG